MSELPEGEVPFWRPVMRAPVGPMPPPEHALAIYKPLVEQFEQAEPMLMVGTDKGVFTTSVAGFERPHLGMLAFAEHLASGGASIGWLVLTSEAWARSMETENEAEGKDWANHFQHGDLEKAAALGDERVVEVVFALARNSLGSGWTMQCPFRRLTGAAVGAVRWGEPQIGYLSPYEEDVDEGQVASDMRELLLIHKRDEG